LKALLVLAMKSSGIALERLDDLAVGLDFDLRAARAQQCLRRQADERIAAEALAADDRLEQVCVRLVRQLQVQRQRRVEVGECLDRQRNPVIAVLCECAEFDFCHDDVPVRRLILTEVPVMRRIGLSWVRPEGRERD
jgi:hypothetical protein